MSETVKNDQNGKNEKIEKNGKTRKIPKRISGTYRFFRTVLYYPVCFICNLRIKGRENEPTPEDGAFLVIAPHRSWGDPIILCAALKHQQPHFMAKQELFKIPLLRGLIRALGAYPVNRGGADVVAIRHTIGMLKDGVAVGMFPQGHRYNKVDPRTTPIKTGAAMIALKAGVPILPVYIKEKDNRHFPFCKKTLIIGSPITPEEMNYNPEAPGEYQRVAEYLFERLCELGD